MFKHYINLKYTILKYFLIITQHEEAYFEFVIVSIVNFSLKLRCPYSIKKKSIKQIALLLMFQKNSHIFWVAE